MSRKHNVTGSLNKVFDELSMIQIAQATNSMSKGDYQRLQDIFKVAGRIRQAYLEQLERTEQNATYA